MSACGRSGSDIRLVPMRLFPVRRSPSSPLLTFYVAVVTLFCICSHHSSNCIEWLALGTDRRQLSWNTTKDCSRAKSAGLVREQRQICQNNIDLMPAVVQASRDTIDICQEMFSDRRWNCSTVLLAPNYLVDLGGNSREQAFVQSLSAAALVQTVAKACSTGYSAKCGCGPTPMEPPPNGQFKWGGCGDDVHYGIAFSKWFADGSATKTSHKVSRRSLINAHNNAVGRKIVGEAISTHCKCHGVSGSCTIKTCYRALPVDLRPDVGVVLRNRYAVAVHVDHRQAAMAKMKAQRGRKRKKNADSDPGPLSDAPSSLSSPAGDRPVPIVNEFKAILREKAVKDEDLVYNAISPDYCLPDAALGSVGTKDRVCDKESSGTGGCRSMCCGRGFTTETVEVRHRCDCKYYWCCYVKCKTCTKTVQIHRCR